MFCPLQARYPLAKYNVLHTDWQTTYWQNTTGKTLAGKIHHGENTHWQCIGRQSTCWQYTMGKVPHGQRNWQAIYDRPVNWGCHFVALLNGNACTWFSKPSFPHQSSHRRHHSLTPLYQLLLEGEEGSNSLEGQILVSIIINPWLNKAGTCSNQLGIIKAWWLSSNDLFGSWENRLIWSELENL